MNEEKTEAAPAPPVLLEKLGEFQEEMEILTSHIDSLEAFTNRLMGLQEKDEKSGPTSHETESFVEQLGLELNRLRAERQKLWEISHRLENAL